MRLLIFIALLPATLSAQIAYQDISASAGLAVDLGNAKGIAFGDYDGDGFDDLYISYSGGVTNRLFRNNGDLTFTDVTIEAGVYAENNGNSGVFGDYDNDGDEDLFVALINEPNIFYRNNGDGTFTDITESLGVGDDAFTRCVLMFDADHDGWLDLYVHNVNAQNQFYRNDEGLGFTNVVFEWGATDTGVAQGAIHYDYDNDGDPDLYLVHDANQDNILYENDGAGHFVNVAEERAIEWAAMGMGVDFGDINNDGFFDVHVTNLGPNSLFVYNPETGKYDWETFSAGVEGNGMSWGTFFWDADNDGLEDLMVVNDSFFSPLPNFVFRNNGDQTFETILEGHPMAGYEASWGAATADLDHDGRLEVVIANANEIGNQLFRNVTPDSGNWLAVKLEGVNCNRSAIGTRVTVYAGELMRMDEVAGGSSFASQHSKVLHFGLGEAAAVDSLEVDWPSGLSETYLDITINGYHTLAEGDSFIAPIEDPYVTLSHDAPESDTDNDKVNASDAVGIATSETDRLNVFPNPGSETVTVTGLVAGEQLTVRQMDGTLVEQRNTIAPRIVLDLGQWASGVYLIQVKGDRGTRALRFVRW